MVVFFVHAQHRRWRKISKVKGRKKTKLVETLTKKELARSAEEKNGEGVERLVLQIVFGNDDEI